MQVLAVLRDSDADFTWLTLPAACVRQRSVLIRGGDSGAVTVIVAGAASRKGAPSVSSWCFYCKWKYSMASNYWFGDMLSLTCSPFNTKNIMDPSDLPRFRTETWVQGSPETSPWEAWPSSPCYLLVKRKSSTGWGRTRQLATQNLRRRETEGPTCFPLLTCPAPHPTPSSHPSDANPLCASVPEAWASFFLPDAQPPPRCLPSLFT